MRIWGAVLVATMMLAGCGGGGGGGGGGNSKPPAEQPPQQQPNVATIDVAHGLYNVPNLPVVSVTVCVPGDASQCQVIDHVLLDTGSTGLRLVDAALRAKAPNLRLPAVPADLSGRPLFECIGFIDGSYAWGGVHRADVKIAGEVASNISVQLIGDTPASNVRPSQCTSDEPSQDLADAANLGANGILGVRHFIEDCGNGCLNVNVGPLATNWYFDCGANLCNPVGVPLASQVKNPVAAFTQDNNGVLVKLPSVSAGGSVGVSGSLIFGIDTRDNNRPGTTPFYQAARLTTFYGNRLYSDAFIDSGSNGLYFDDPAIPLCNNSIFYCPGNTLNLAATVGDNTSTQTVSFSVANLRSLSGNNFAFDNIAGLYSFIVPDSSGDSSQVFDWGLPFFFGRTIYVGMEGTKYEGQIGF